MKQCEINMEIGYTGCADRKTCWLPKIHRRQMLNWRISCYFLLFPSHSSHVARIDWLVMTVQYSLAAATATGLTFWRLLRLWRGSVWKLVVVELIVWAVCCVALAISYFFLVKDGANDEAYCSVLVQLDSLPVKASLSVLLGFTARTCMNRWMEVYKSLMWPEGLALMFNSFFDDDALPPATSRAVRHSVYRYLLLCYILILRDISISVKKQFPTYKHLIKAKLLTNEELKLFDSANIEPDYCRYWIPVLWIAQTIKKYYVPQHERSAGQRSVMKHAHYGTFMAEMARLRATLGDILCYDWIPIPLANTQTITFAVYSYLIVDGILQHYPLCKYEELNIVALASRFAFSLLLNTFYLGWLKCSQVILNPFGLDDDDYEANSLVDMYQRNLAAILTRPEKTPPVQTHVHRTLPHTVASALLSGRSETSLVGSMAGKQIPASGQEIVSAMRPTKEK
ncbi:hypothetical protein RB195_002321 [Necator americanus]|uniref:Bestrophin homolog n=1 Tax=Necator americanus TaxID=51031 RepID=A0ABR1DIG2_NECAM